MVHNLPGHTCFKLLVMQTGSYEVPPRLLGTTLEVKGLYHNLQLVPYMPLPPFPPWENGEGAVGWISGLLQGNRRW